MKLIIKEPRVLKIGERAHIGDNFTVTSSKTIPKKDTSKRRYKITLRSRDIQKYRFYASQLSPGCVHIEFEEVKS